MERKSVGDGGGVDNTVLLPMNLCERDIFYFT